jgi:hypothetical protein
VSIAFSSYVGQVFNLRPVCNRPVRASTELRNAASPLRERSHPPQVLAARLPLRRFALLPQQAFAPRGNSVGQTIGFCRLSVFAGSARHDRPRNAMVCPTGLPLQTFAPCGDWVGQTIGFCRLSVFAGSERHDRPRNAMVCPTWLPLHTFAPCGDWVGQTIGFCRLSVFAGSARRDRPRKAMVCPTWLPGVRLRLRCFVGQVGNLRPSSTRPSDACTLPLHAANPRFSSPPTQFPASQGDARWAS